jgi:hypothetical protein
MASNCCSEVDDLTVRRQKKKQEEVWAELAQAVAALKDSEIHLLKASIAMEDAMWHSKNMDNMYKWAQECEEAANGSHNFLLLVGSMLGHSDPFSVEDDDDDSG